MLNRTPLHILTESEAAIVLGVLAQSMGVTHLRSIGHSSIWINAAPYLTMPSDNITSLRCSDLIEVSTHTSRLCQWLNGTLPPTNDLVFYTDGSLINESPGAGIYCENLGIENSIPLGNFSTIFLVEVMTIISCEGVILTNITDDNFIICTDSHSAIKALSRSTISSSLALVC